MRSIVIAFSLIATSEANALSGADIVSLNTPSVVYLEAINAKGEVTDRGTGFVVSHDGHVLTAAHVKPEPGGKLLAVIGQKVGLQLPLTLREADEANDVALWKLPQAAVCRPAVTISTKSIKVLDRVIVLGFPESDGLSPGNLGITSLSTPEHGFYRADAYLWPGNSGGPVLDQDGRVIALVQGGTLPGTERNDLIPISFSIALLKKWNVNAGIDQPLTYDLSCYQSCPNPSKVVGWTSQIPWSSGSSGWMSGGHNQTDECNKMVAAFLANRPGMQIDIKDRGENSKKDVFGHVEYEYFCSGLLKSNPSYAIEQSVSCPLRQ